MPLLCLHSKQLIDPFVHVKLSQGYPCTAVIGQGHSTGRHEGTTAGRVTQVTKAFLTEGHTAWDSFLSNASSSVSCSLGGQIPLPKRLTQVSISALFERVPEQYGSTVMNPVCLLLLEVVHAMSMQCPCNVLYAQNPEWQFVLVQPQSAGCTQNAAHRAQVVHSRHSHLSRLNRSSVPDLLHLWVHVPGQRTGLPWYMKQLVPWQHA